MSAFDKVIGYRETKEELLQICDMIHERSSYAALGAKMPHGIMLYGRPGMGKTLMANCLIAESGLTSYTLRRNAGSDDFVNQITETFLKAKENAPCLIFLDDMDKFANEDSSHRDAPEYAAVQAGIDEVRGSEVFVIATANATYKLPKSLLRPGRFDRKIELHQPTSSEAHQIIRHYLQDRPISPDVNMEDVCRMISYSSCAELETLVNEAAILAAFRRRKYITIEDLVGALLRVEFEEIDSCFEEEDEYDLWNYALHEAGHLVVCEILSPGSVGLAYVCHQNRETPVGFVRRCRELPHRMDSAVVSLAGKAAAELYDAQSPASGCRSDLKDAITLIREDMTLKASAGMWMLDLETLETPAMSESLKARTEAVVHAELERCLLQAKDILMKNRDFLELTAKALMRKSTLLHSEIQALRRQAEELKTV